MTQDAVYTQLGCLWAKIMMSSVSKQDLSQVSTIITTEKKKIAVARQCQEIHIVTAHAAHFLSSGTTACIETSSPKHYQIQSLSIQVQVQVLQKSPVSHRPLLKYHPPPQPLNSRERWFVLHNLEFLAVNLVGQSLMALAN